MHGKIKQSMLWQTVKNIQLINKQVFVDAYAFDKQTMGSLILECSNFLKEVQKYYEAQSHENKDSIQSKAVVDGVLNVATDTTQPVDTDGTVVPTTTS